ncbi:hypothetical protein [Actinopolymorpha rutila]|uniref:Uncharacterized protein n=1 Tax=Actinopolymorpha rutila TaxID=446787 RepID=A0A852ZJF2_9ACTN|nr:hypothetical protein [Actinopolymorpha rutila]NYH92373.1 hypothetical protein [Actinopolymorpha rutila]
MSVASFSDDVLGRCAALGERSDEELGADQLGMLDVHATRDRATLRTWAKRAHSYGEELGASAAAEPGFPGAGERLQVREADGGIEVGRILLAEYLSRPASVVLHRDALTLAEELIDVLGWQGWYPPGSVRKAALAHEYAHEQLQRPNRRELKNRIGYVAVRLGHWQLHGHVVGADEIAAHGYAKERVGLGRSPLALTAALGEIAATGRG